MLCRSARMQPGFSTMASPDEPKKWYRFTTDRVRLCYRHRLPATRSCGHGLTRLAASSPLDAQGGVYEYYIENTAADKRDEDLAYEHMS